MLIISPLSLCSFTSNSNENVDIFGLLLKRNTDVAWNSKDPDMVKASLDWLKARSVEGNKKATEAIFNLAQNHHDPLVRAITLEFLKINFASDPRTIRLVIDGAWNSKDAAKVEAHLNWLKARADEGNKQVIEAIFNFAQNHHNQKVSDKMLRVLMTGYASDTRTMRLVVDKAWNSKDVPKVEESLTWIKARAGEGNPQANKELIKIAQFHPDPNVRKKILDYLNR